MVRPKRVVAGRGRELRQVGRKLGPRGDRSLALGSVALQRADPKLQRRGIAGAGGAHRAGARPRAARPTGRARRAASRRFARPRRWQSAASTLASCASSLCGERSSERAEPSGSFSGRHRRAPCPARRRDAPSDEAARRRSEASPSVAAPLVSSPGSAPYSARATSPARVLDRLALFFWNRRGVRLEQRHEAPGASPGATSVSTCSSSLSSSTSAADRCGRVKPSSVWVQFRWSMRRTRSARTTDLVAGSSLLNSRTRSTPKA